VVIDTDSLRIIDRSSVGEIPFWLAVTGNS